MSALSVATEVEHFALPKGTGTYADALAACGLQELLELLSGVPFNLRDGGDHFELAVPRGEGLDLDRLDYDTVRRTGGYRYVHLPKDQSPSVLEQIDYAGERKKLLATRAMNDSLRKSKRSLTDEDREQLAQIAPMPNWSLYQNVNVLQGFGSYVSLHQEIRASDPAAFDLAVRNRLAALATPDVPARTGKVFAGKVSAVQVFNPVVGKGTSGVKPSGSALAGLPGFYVDWFTEWLRYIGMGIAMRALSLDKDVKVYVMAPGALNATAIKVVAEDFRSVPSGFSSARADVLLSIRVALALVRRSGLISGAGDQISIRRRRPNDVVSGLHTAYFKSLGQSRALSNISFVGLPGWFPITEDSVGDWIDALEDHDRALRVLDENRTEEAALLVRYRDFLSAGPELIEALLDFLGAYAIHVFHGRERGRPTPTLRIGVLSSFLRRLFMEQRPELTPILENGGFQRVAAAIRRATVSEQFFKARQMQEYEIHYGLLQELQRKARFKDQFVAELAEFITSYNTENARKAEQSAGGRGSRRRRSQVTTGDLADIVHLLDVYPTETVAMLLLAYAAASNPRTVPSAEATPGEPEPAAEELGEPGNDES